MNFSFLKKNRKHFNLANVVKQILFVINMIVICRRWNPGMRYGRSLKTGPKADCDSWIMRFPWIPFLRMAVEVFAFKHGVDPEVGLREKKTRLVRHIFECF